MNKAIEGIHTNTKQTVDHGEKKTYETATKSPYADALNRQLPSTHAGTLSQIRARNRQILIDKSPDVPANFLSNLDENKLVEKANTALSKMSTRASAPQWKPESSGPKNYRTRHRIRTQQPRVRHMARKEKTEFTKHYDRASIIKDKAVSILIEYIPITHNPDSLGESKKIERETGLLTDSIDSIRWIKPTSRRTVGQRTAHLITKLRSPEAANQALRDSLIIEGKRVWLGV